jgi:chromatin segregation and condensation protein Rec8/ScpA/Scc1 (kleisin family)
MHIRPVLAANNKASGQTAKGKNAALDKWDQETRSALAAKKKAAPAPALSKADKALVEGQLKKEAEIRQRVQTVVADVRQALCCIESLTFSKAEGLSGLVPELLTALLAAIKAPQAELFQEQAFQTFLVRLSLLDR